MFRRFFYWLKRLVRPQASRSWTIEYQDRCLFRENGQVVYQGLLADMPSDIRKRWDEYNQDFLAMLAEGGQLADELREQFKDLHWRCKP